MHQWGQSHFHGWDGGGLRHFPNFSQPGGAQFCKKKKITITLCIFCHCLPLFSGLLFIKSNIKLDTGGHCCHTRVLCAACSTAPTLYSTLTRHTTSQRNIFPPLQRSYQIFLIYTKIHWEFKKGRNMQHWGERWERTKSCEKMSNYLAALYNKWIALK